MGNVLIYAEHNHGKFPKTTLVAVSAGLEAASRNGGECHAVVIGKGIDGLATNLAGHGVKKVIAVDDASLEHYVADSYAAVVSQLAKDGGYAVVLGTATAVGKDLFPRLAVRLGAGMASDVTAVTGANTYLRPMWAGNVIATVQLDGPVQVVTVRATAFDAAPASPGGAVEKKSVAVDEASRRTKFVEYAETKSDRPVLTEASIVVSGGRGLKNGENFTIYLEPLCDALGAAMGASRAAVDAGFVPNDLQIGQTGKVVAPSLYIAVGISGAIQHLAGMKDSKVIVAVNKDEEAPIFQVADYGLVGDLFKEVPALTEEVKKLKH
jgi:electron transfer flavoprotein alpha subunit